LKAGAHVVGKLGELGTSFSVNEKNESSDGVGTSAAVVEDVGKSFVSPLDDVLSKGAEKIGKERVGKV
jgi:hypothetical protein